MPPSRRTNARASVSSSSELLPDPLTPVTQTIAEKRELNGDALEVVGRDAFDRDRPGLGHAAALLGHGNPLDAGQIAAGERLGIGGDLVGRALGDDAAAVPARAGPRSTIQSACRMIVSSCSTTTTVLPRDCNSRSVSISRWLSRGCRPIDGSSST